MQIVKRIFILLTPLIFILMSTLAQATEFTPLSTTDFVYSEQGKSAIEQVETALANEEVMEKLLAYGVDEHIARERLASLTPAEANQLAEKFEELPKAGSEIVVLLLVIIIVILLN